jgi:hypothetical protein
MNLSDQQIKIIETYIDEGKKVLSKVPFTDISVARINKEVLEKLNFRNSKALPIEVNIFNETYFKKGRTPQSDEEAQEWLKEGAWQVSDKYVVTLINDIYLLDLHIGRATRPEKRIFLKPLLTKVTEDFIRGEDRCGFVHNSCLITYNSFPTNLDYQKSKDWQDKTKTNKIVSEIYSGVKVRLRK